MGETTDDGFLYKPSLGATGAVEKGKFDDGMDRVDNRLDNEIWVGDPDYGTTIASAVTAIGVNEATLRIPPAAQSIATNTTIPTNVLYRPEKTGIATVATTKTLTINGGVDESVGHYQIFAWEGTGTFVFGKPQVFKAAWFGVSTSAADNSAAMAKAMTCIPAGSTLVFDGGTFLFTTPVLDGTSIPNGIIIKGTGATYMQVTGSTRISSLSGGTIFKYTGTDKWWYLRVAAGAGGIGKWQFRDFNVWCTEYQADGMVFNDMAGAAGFTGTSYPGWPTGATEAVLNNLAFSNVSFFGGAVVGSSCGNGLSICGGFQLKIDESCHFRNWKRAVWLRDCDMPDIAPRSVACDRYIHAEMSVPGATYYVTGNEGIIRGAIHESYDYGETNRYGIWDNCKSYTYETMQWEGATGNIIAYLDGMWTKIRGVRLSATITTPTATARIGPNAMGIVFDSCHGRNFDPADTAWPTIVIDDVSAIYGVNDYSVYFQNCSREFMALVPTHPRVKLGEGRNSQPGLSGWDAEQYARYSWAGRSDIYTDALQLNARLGLGHLRRADYYSNPFTRNFVGPYGAYTAATVVADANGYNGYAIRSAYPGTAQGVGYAFKVGRDIEETDALYWEARYKCATGPTEGTYIKIYNNTTSTSLVERMVGVSTSYATARGILQLSEYSGSISAGDILYVYFLNKDTGKYTDFAWFSIMPGEQVSLWPQIKFATFDKLISITASSSIACGLAIPTGAKLEYAAMIVREALAGGETWDANWDTTGTVQNICTAAAVALGTTATKLFDVAPSGVAKSNITTGTTDILITKNGGGSFTAQGKIRVVGGYWVASDLV